MFNLVVRALSFGQGRTPIKRALASTSEGGPNQKKRKGNEALSLLKSEGGRGGIRRSVHSSKRGKKLSPPPSLHYSNSIPHIIFASSVRMPKYEDLNKVFEAYRYDIRVALPFFVPLDLCDLHAPLPSEFGTFQMKRV